MNSIHDYNKTTIKNKIQKLCRFNVKNEVQFIYVSKYMYGKCL